MTPAKRVVPALFFLGVIHARSMTPGEVLSGLEQTFGGSLVSSPVFPFSATDYYETEMGDGLLRFFVVLPGLHDPVGILDVKRRARSLEMSWSVGGRRRVNIDPGYLDPHKVVLISEKYSGRKVYLGAGMYADVTLTYERGEFRGHHRSFPDFRIPAGGSDWPYRSFFVEMRDRYLEALKNAGDGAFIDPAGITTHPPP